MLAPTKAGISNTLPDSQTVSPGYNLDSQSLQVGIDWLQFLAVVPSEWFISLLDTAIKPFDDEYSLEAGVPVNRGKPFANSGRTVRGGAIAWNDLDGGFKEVWVSLPAGVLSQVSLREIWEISALLKFTYNAVFSRVDVRLDDYLKQLNPADIMSAYEQGNYAKFQRLQEIKGFKAGKQDGWTIYFGSPQSEKRARLYDKSAESQGRLDCYRLEVQLRRGSADVAMSVFLDVPSFDELASAFLGALVAGAIDFPERVHAGEREKNLDRCDRLPWWQAFLDRVGSAIRLSPARPQPTFQQKLTWIDRQVQVALAQVRDVLGGKVFETWLQNQIDSGRSRYRVFHEKTIQIAKRDYEKQVVPC